MGRCNGNEPCALCFDQSGPIAAFPLSQRRSQLHTQRAAPMGPEARDDGDKRYGPAKDKTPGTMVGRIRRKAVACRVIGGARGASQMRL